MRGAASCVQQATSLRCLIRLGHKEKKEEKTEKFGLYPLFADGTMPAGPQLEYTVCIRNVQKRFLFVAFSSISCGILAPCLRGIALS
jgi:hypothetical protein